jgi:hypothetical protein
MRDTVRRRRGPALLAALLVVLLLIVLQPAAEALAATFDVNQTADADDANVGDGICDVDAGTAGNQCSLRAAVRTANALGGSHVIRLPAGTYLLNHTGADEDAAATGDLDITADITVRSANNAVGTVTIDGNASDRVFEVRSGRNLTLIGVTVTNGNPGNAAGGAILSSGTLTLLRTTASRYNAARRTEARVRVAGGTGPS